MHHDQDGSGGLAFGLGFLLGRSQGAARPRSVAEEVERRLLVEEGLAEARARTAYRPGRPWTPQGLTGPERARRERDRLAAECLSAYVFAVGLGCLGWVVLTFLSALGVGR